jgi:predicted transcriptional regulator
MTTFKAAIDICGLAHKQAADYFGVSQATIKTWSSGKTPPPIYAWHMLASLLEQIMSVADRTSANLELSVMNRAEISVVKANDSSDELPGSAGDAASAMAIMMAIQANRKR